MVYNIINNRNRTGSPEKEEKKMLALREEKLNMVNGGISIGSGICGPKFSMGDRVISKSDPDYGVGTVLESTYNEGWWYTVAMDSGMLYTSEADLEYAIL